MQLFRNSTIGDRVSWRKTDTGVIGYFKSKAGKRGYQTLINEALKKVTNSGSTEQNGLEKTFRKAIREELSSMNHAH